MKYLILLTVLFSTGLQAGGIHKWVDSEGNTHYGDAPPAETNTQQIRVLGAPSEPGRVLPRLKIDQSDTQANAPKISAEQAAVICQQAREVLDVISSSSTVQLKLADGSQRYLSTEEIAARKERAEADVKQFCP